MIGASPFAPARATRDCFAYNVAMVPQDHFSFASHRKGDANESRYAAESSERHRSSVDKGAGSNVVATVIRQ